MVQLMKTILTRAKKKRESRTHDGITKKMLDEASGNGMALGTSREKLKETLSLKIPDKTKRLEVLRSVMILLNKPTNRSEEYMISQIQKVYDVKLVEKITDKNIKRTQAYLSLSTIYLSGFSLANTLESLRTNKRTPLSDNKAFMAMLISFILSRITTNTTLINKLRKCRESKQNRRMQVLKILYKACHM